MKTIENFQDIKVNSQIIDNTHIKKALFDYLYKRVWEDEDLLGSFDNYEIDDIIKQTLNNNLDTINHFVAVLLEEEANKRI